MGFPEDAMQDSNGAADNPQFSPALAERAYAGDEDVPDVSEGYSIWQNNTRPRATKQYLRAASCVRLIISGTGGWTGDDRFRFYTVDLSQ
jgi:hypothetical protein